MQIRELIGKAKKRARDIGVPFDLDVSDLFPGPIACPVLGMRLRYGGLGRRTPNTATLDRSRNALGYVRGNVAIVSWRANEVKRDANADELAAVLAYVKRIEQLPEAS